MRKIFIDTNVVIDLLDKRAGFYQSAADIFTLAYHQEVTLYISPITYATASYLLRKHGKEGARLLLSNLRQLSRVLITDECTIDDSLSSDFDDFEDAIQYYSAKRMNVDVILTRNVKDFTKSSIPVMTPNEYLAVNSL